MTRTTRPVVLVAHGSPSNSGPPDRALRVVAEQVAAAQPDGVVRAATLARPGSLAVALEGLTNPLIYPVFMAEGWFVRRELPRRLAEIGHNATILPPLGIEPELPALIARTVTKAAISAGTEPESADLLLIAHGSRRMKRSKTTALAMAETLRRITPFWRVLTAFVEESPFITEIAAISRKGVCLPFFAQRSGHVADDIPDALTGFNGPLLPAIGEHPDLPALIARSLVRQLPTPVDATGRQSVTQVS